MKGEGVSAEENDVDQDIVLDADNPLMYQDRALQWSGSRRIPNIGETVLWREMMAAVIVETYFQAHGWLGVEVRNSDGNLVALFGGEIALFDGPDKLTVS